MINAYFIMTNEEQPHKIMIDPEIGGPTEWGKDFAIVLAPTRGAARSLFCRRFSLEFIEPIAIQKIAGPIEGEPGIADWRDPLWLILDPDLEDWL